MPMHSSEMLSVWYSLAWHLKDRLTSVDSVCATIITEMTLARVPKNEYLPFMQAEIERMIDEIAEAREIETVSARKRGKTRQTVDAPAYSESAWT